MQRDKIVLRLRGWACCLAAGALVLGALAAPRPVQAEGVLYFGDIFNPTFSDGWLRRVNTDGTGLETLVTTGGGLRGVSLDPGGGKVYWTNVDTDKIRRANLDGSNPEDLITTGLAFPMSIDVDLAGGMLYWGDQSLDQIGRAGLNGSGAGPLVSTPFGGGVAVDSINEKVYWTTALTGSEGDIMRANLDGTNVETVLTGVDKPARIALDVTGGKIYWTDFVVDVVRRSNLNGSGVEDLFVVGANLNPGGIALDLDGGKVYWGQSVTTNREKIMRMNLDGSNPEDVISGFGNVTEIAFLPEPTTLMLLVAGGLAVLKRRR